MIVIVAGGRDTTNDASVFRALDGFHKRFPITLLIEGGQRKWSKRLKRVVGGVDYWAHEWAKARGIEVRTIEADWDTYGKSAGPKRNREMAAYPGAEALIALPGGDGTANMKQEALKRGLKVWEVGSDGDATIKRVVRSAGDEPISRTAG